MAGKGLRNKDFARDHKYDHDLNTTPSILLVWKKSNHTRSCCLHLLRFLFHPTPSNLQPAMLFEHHISRKTQTLIYKKALQMINDSENWL